MNTVVECLLWLWMSFLKSGEKNPDVIIRLSQFTEPIHRHYKQRACSMEFKLYGHLQGMQNVMKILLSSIMRYVGSGVSGASSIVRSKNQ